RSSTPKPTQPSSGSSLLSTLLRTDKFLIFPLTPFIYRIRGTTSNMPQLSASMPPVPQIIITPASDDRDAPSSQSEFVALIPATNRSVYKTISKEDGHLFRPSSDISQDPFRHAHPSSPAQACSIQNCEYCALCTIFNLDPHAVQATWVVEGTSSKRWDPYFHWIMNEQIPRLDPNHLGSRNWSNCWIEGCACRVASTSDNTTQQPSEPSAESPTCPCGRLRDTQKTPCNCSTDGAQYVYYINTSTRDGNPYFPYQICPRYSQGRLSHLNHRMACSTCTLMDRCIRGKGATLESVHLTAGDRKHNELLRRRIAFALSPLSGRDPEARKAEWTLEEDWKDMFFNLGPRRVRFEERSTGRPGAARATNWNRPRALSPYPRGLESLSEGLGFGPYDGETTSRLLLGGTTVDSKRHMSSRGQTRVTESHRKVRALCSSNSGYDQNTIGRKSLGSSITDVRLFAATASQAFSTNRVASGNTMPTAPVSGLALERALSRLLPSQGSGEADTTQDTPAGSSSTPTRPSARTSRSVGANEDGDRQEAFERYLHQLDPDWNVPKRRPVKLQHISFWKKIKIICGFSKDPNNCEICWCCKTACEC
ncbi:hypothetical protein BKA67DRAFT_666195, partial [Truncatella angustata]